MLDTLWDDIRKCDKNYLDPDYINRFYEQVNRYSVNKLGFKILIINYIYDIICIRTHI